MATLTLDACPVEIDVCVTRGDTSTFSFTMKNAAGVIVDITGFSYILTVDPSKDPADATANLFLLTGTVPVGTDGVVQFAMTVLQANQTPDFYFFDIQQTDGASALRTVVKGKYEFRQDITK